MNQLLAYIQDRSNAFYRPWTWVVAMFIGPMVRGRICSSFNHLKSVSDQLPCIRILYLYDGKWMEWNESRTKYLSRCMWLFSWKVLLRRWYSTIPWKFGSKKKKIQVIFFWLSMWRIYSYLLPDQDKGKTKESENPSQQTKQPRGGNLVGKINNLITTDLLNITNGRHFIYLGTLW